MTDAKEGVISPDPFVVTAVEIVDVTNRKSQNLYSRTVKFSLLDRLRFMLGRTIYLRINLMLVDGSKDAVYIPSWRMFEIGGKP